MVKNLCFVTASRADYCPMKWVMKEVEKTDRFNIQIVATGAHLLNEQGCSDDLIELDGFVVTKIVDAVLDTSSLETIAESMGRMAQLFSHTFKELSPDYVVVLGDRYELLPIVNTAFVMRIPIIHLSGGDITEGAIDDGIRNAVTMLSEYHFPGTEDSAERIIRMRGSSKKVWNVGEPGLDSFYREELMSREELANDLSLDKSKKWILFTYHAETKESLEYNLCAVRDCIEVLAKIKDIQVVATYANADYGGKEINDYLNKARSHMEKLFVIAYLGNRRYLSLMRHVSCVIGNSSSGIIETPFLGVPAVNVGKRQNGRHICANVIQTDCEYDAIKSSIENALSKKAVEKDMYWGDGHTAEKIIEILEKELQ